MRRSAILGLAVAMAIVGGCASRSPADETAGRLAGRAQARRLTCESRSAADLLAYYRLPGSESDVFERLARSDNPDQGFVGDPDGPPGRLPPEGYGVHAAPIVLALRTLSLDARVETGRDWRWLMSETAVGRPVIVWVTGSCDPSSVTVIRDASGHTFRAVRGEHTMLVVAADGAGATVVDPALGLRRRFDREEFEAAWSLFDYMAVSATGPIVPATRAH